MVPYGGDNHEKTYRRIYEGKTVYSDALKYLEYVTGKNTDIMKRFSIGKSVQGRDLFVYKLGNGSKKVFINAEHHPREYITSMILINHIDLLTAAYRKDERVGGMKVKELLENVTFYFLPFVNPDGLEICTRQNPGWYFNSRGVDLNGNYDAEWKNVNETDSTYSTGDSVFSEPETRAVMKFCELFEFDLSIAYHAAGEIIYWYFSQQGPDEERDHEIARILGETTGYRLVTREESLSHAERGGGFKDWMVDKLHKPAFTIEVGEGSITEPIDFDKYGVIWKQNREVPVRAGQYLHTQDIPVKADKIKIIVQGGLVQYRDILVKDGSVFFSVPDINRMLGRDLKPDRSGGTPGEKPVPPIEKEGQLYLPLRATAEGLGYKVEWEGGTRTVYLSR